MAEAIEGVVDTQVEAGATGGNSPGSESFDRPALEEKVSQGLASLFNDAEDDETPADKTAETSAGETPAEDAVNEDGEGEPEDTDESDNKETTEEAKKEEAAAAPATGNVPTLPDSYRRSLKAYGWEDAEIDQNMKVMGPSFLITAQKIHANRNAEIATWADAGRRAREANKPADQTPQKFEAIKPIDGTALKEHYGDDKLIDSLLSPINAVVAQINAMVPAIQQTQQKSQTSELETLGRQIEGFFGGKELQPFTEVYGTATKTLTPEQITTRNRVLETADALICGARYQGRTLGLGEALTLAHDSISGDYKAKAARQEITSTLQKREKGITLRPGNKSKSAASGGPPAKTRGDLEKRVANRMKSVFS
jgi:hypothetical protein